MLNTSTTSLVMYCSVCAEQMHVFALTHLPGLLDATGKSAVCQKTFRESYIMYAFPKAAVCPD